MEPNTLLWSCVLFSLLVVLLNFCWTVFWNIYLSPLKNIPGPLLAKVSALYMFLAEIPGERTHKIHSLHQKYGPIIRTGPNELVFSGPDAVKDIYGLSTACIKAPIYESLGRPSLFNFRDKYVHRERRRLMSHALSQSTMLSTEPLLGAQVKKLIGRLESHNGSPVDVLHWFRMLAVDVVGDLFLGKPFGALDLDQNQSLAYVEDMDNIVLYFQTNRKFPTLVKLLRSYGPQKLRHFLGSEERFYKCSYDAYGDYIERYGRHSQRMDAISKMVNRTDNEKGLLTDDDVAVEFGSLAFAGTDTMSITLTYLFWHFAKHEPLQNRLFAELRAALGKKNDNIQFNDISSLPFLEAVLNEALRVYGAIPAGLARQVPREGAIIGGIHVPPGTIVSAQAHTTHRDPVVFPEPEIFKPDRWLDPVGGTQEMKDMFLAWSKGTRVCIGRNLAIMELKLVIASALLKFRITCAPGLRDEDMRMLDHFVAFPKGGKCELMFTMRE